MRAKRNERPWLPRPEDLPDERDLALLPQLGDVAENPLFRRLIRAFPRGNFSDELGSIHRIRLALLIALLVGNAVAFVLPDLPMDRIAFAVLASCGAVSIMGFPLPRAALVLENQRDRVAKLADPLLALAPLDGTSVAAAMIARYRARRFVAMERRFSAYGLAASAGLLYFIALLGSLQRVPVSLCLWPAMWLAFVGFELGLGRGAILSVTRELATARLKGWFLLFPLPDAIGHLACTAPMLLACLAFLEEIDPKHSLNLHLHVHPPTFLGIGLGVALLGACLGRLHFRFALARGRPEANFELLAWRLEPLIFPADPDPARPVPASVRRWKRQVMATRILAGTVVVIGLAALGFGVRHARHHSGALRGGMTQGRYSKGYAVAATGRLDSHQRYFLRRGDVTELNVDLSTPADFDPLRKELARSRKRRLEYVRIAGLPPERFGEVLIPGVEYLVLEFGEGPLDAAPLLDPARASDLQKLVLLGRATLSDPSPLLHPSLPRRIVLGLPDLPEPNVWVSVPWERLIFYSAPGLRTVRIEDASKVERLAFLGCDDLVRVEIERGPASLVITDDPQLEEVELGEGGGSREIHIANNPLLRRLRIGSAPNLEALRIEGSPALETLELGDAPKLAQVGIEGCERLDYAGVEFGAADVTIVSELGRAIEALLVPPTPPPVAPAAAP